MRSLLAVAVVAAAASVASADPYLGLGIGTAARPSGDHPSMSSDGNRSGRLIAGWSWGHFSVEAIGVRFGERVLRMYFYDGTMLSVSGKYNLPLGDGFEAFGRLGLERTWLSIDAANEPDFQGNGWLIAGGFEYRLKIAATAASLFVEYERSSTNLVNQSATSYTGHQAVGIWSLGATVSL